MAPHGPPKVAMDPALVRHSNMLSDRHKYFRPTPRNTRIALWYFVWIPGALLYLGAKTDGKWEFRNKMKGDVIAEF